MNCIKKVFAAFAAFCICVPLSAEFNSKGIDDSAEIRRQIASAWFESPAGTLTSNEEAFYENDVGKMFQVRMEETRDEYMIIVAPQSQVDVDILKNGTHNIVRAAVYPERARGSWVLYRDKKTLKPTKIHWYFNQNEEVYAVIRPFDRKTLVDMVVYSSYAARSVALGIPFLRFYSMSLEEFEMLTKKVLPWNKVNIVPGQYYDSLQMVGMIRSNLDKIEYTEDACYDEKGVLRSIITGKEFTLRDDFGRDYKPESDMHLLSGAGFLKWIIDGVIEPVTGRGTKISDLTEPTVDINPQGKAGVMSQNWNMTFSLDWCRNLAAKNLSVTSRRDLDFITGGVDVKYNHFASEMENGVLVNSAGYLSDTGYRIDKIKSILYVLAVTEPSWFYLAAVRQQSLIRPDELVFNDCAVFFPYFDDAGKFGCYVFEQGKEMSLDQFIENYGKSYVHLERVHATDNFFPYINKNK